MNPYLQLRKQAAENRDSAIRAAREGYKQAIRRIEELESSVGGGTAEVIGRTRDRPVIQLVCDLMPRDRAFTQSEMIEWLQASAPARKFHIPTIPATFQRLLDRGIIRRVRKKHGGVTLWAAADSCVPIEKFGAMTLVDVAETVLRECGPCDPVSLVVEIQRRGYRKDVDPKALLNSLQGSLKRSPRRFKRDKARGWSVIT